MKLYLEDDEAGQAIYYLLDSDPAPDGYTITNNPIHWNTYIDRIETPYSDVRNEMIDKFEPNWGGFTVGKKKALVENYIWPAETSSDDLNELFGPDERDIFRGEVIEKIKASGVSVMKSTTSEKQFVIVIDDDGVLSSSEIKTDSKI